MSSYPRLGTAAGNRAMASAQRSYDNMTPEDVYGPDDDEEPEEKPERVICDHAGEKCADDCEHGSTHDRSDSCGPFVCNLTGKDCFCIAVEE